MAKANIHDRQSIARVYPPEAFAVDAAENQKQPANEVLLGVCIYAAPDAKGDFEIERASRHRGEAKEAAFLPAQRILCAQNTAGDAEAGGKAASRSGQAFATRNPAPAADYDNFIDAVIEAAPRSGFRPNESPGPGDARLRGLGQ